MTNSAIVELRGSNLVFGAEWLSHQDAFKNKDIEEQIAKRGIEFFANFSTKLPSEDDGQINHLALPDESIEGAITDLAKKGQPAIMAAGLLLSNYENITYVMKLPDTEFVWVCIIHEGQVLIEGDTLLPLEDFQKHLEAHLLNLGISMDDLLIYCDIEDDKDGFGINVAEQISIRELLINEAENLNDFEPKKLSVTVTKRNEIFVLTLMAVALVGYMLFFGEKEEVVTSPPPVNLEKLKVDLPDIDDEDIVSNNSVSISTDSIYQNAFDEERAWLNYTFSQSDSYKVLERLVESARGTDVFKGGWVAENLYFDISEPEFHEIVWKKMGYGTALTLKNTLESEGIRHISFNDKGTKVSSFRVEKGMGKDKDVDVLELIQSGQSNIFSFTHDLDINNFAWASEITAESERPEPIDGIKNMARAKERQLKLQTRSFRIRGNGLDYLNKLSIILAKHDKFLLERVSLSFEQGLSWIVYGVYYEKQITNK